ncbi:hypothetical protein [Cognaticolwellia mytili]|uniref:hypothetical protein n=1 Tax=Cognaticolwellia mytili TaxID=1888913 RepID=UPI000A16CED4|nr:hypothetical protein [Cognaticolwellia mytili]
MFKYYSIKKYGVKLLPALEKRYGIKPHYNPSEVRATVYQSNFNPKYLPLAYLLFLEQNALKNVLYTEYPELNIGQYKQEIINYLNRKRYHGYLQKLA